MVDKVKPLKIETDADGTEIDFVPTEADPTEDFVAVKGIALENSDDTTIRGDAGVMKFKDSDVTTEVSLQDLVSGSTPEHGDLVGLADDDHPQYLNESRHDSLSADNPHAVDLSQTLIEDNDAGGLQIRNIADPTLAQDAATKQYVDDEIDNHELTIDNHGDVDVSTTAPVDTNILRFDGTNWIPSRERQFTQLSGRFEIDTDDDWACWSDPNFGPSLQDWDLDLGNGAVPNIDWDGMGLLFPAGATLKRIFVKVRGNNADIDSVQLHARAHDVDLLAGSAIDSNGEIGAFDITTQTIDLDAGVGSANDVRGFEVSLNDYTFTDTGDLHIMMRSVVGSTTANRQLRTTIFIEWELPV